MSIKTNSYIIIFFLAFSCVSFSQDQPPKQLDKKARKELKIASNYQKTKALIESDNFDYEADWVFPLGKPRISLLGNINRLRFENNVLEANLPYFGTRYNDGYASAGINFKSEINEYEVDYQDDDYRILIKFVVADEKERYQFDLEIESDGSGRLYFASNKRNSQTYSGQILPIKKK
jgi:hypothetical protein